MDLTRRLDDGVLTLTMDDGRKNALDPAAFDLLRSGFDDAGDDVRAIVLTGRPDIFSAGLDVKWMGAAGPDELRDLLLRFGRTLMRIWSEPRPVVAAVGGHAVAAGTMLAMCCDHAVAAEGPHRWGLTETRIGFQIPDFALELTRHNVAADRVDDLLLPGAMVEAAEAVGIGFADELAPADEVVPRAQAHARELMQLPAAAYAGTKRRLRGDATGRVLDGIEADVDALVAAAPTLRPA